MSIHGLKLLSILSLGIVCSSCSLKSDSVKILPTVPLHLTLCASKNINVNVKHEPSPLVITVFQLQSKQPFLSATYEKLSGTPNEELKESLIDQCQYEIRPGERVHIQQTLLPETNFLGVIAGYRVIPDAKWRVILPIMERKKIKCFEVIAEAQRILVQPSFCGAKHVKL